MICFSRTILQTIFQFIARIFSTSANFILLLLVARKFGSDGLGSYNKVFSFIAFFVLFVDFGLNSIFIKLPDYRKRFVSLISLRFILSFVLLIILQPLLFVLPYNPVTQTGFSLIEKMYIEIIAFSLILYSFIHSFMAVIQKERIYEKAIIPQIIYAVIVLMTAVAGFQSRSLSLFFVATIVGLVGQIVSLAFLLRFVFLKASRMYTISFANIKPFMTDLLKRSIPIGTTLFLNSLYVRVDVFILALLRPTGDVGVYTLAYKFFEFPLIFSFFIMNSLYPQMVMSYQIGIKNLNVFIKNRMWKMIAFSVLLSIIAFVFAPLITLIKGDFIGSVSAFRILALSYPIFFFSNILLWTIITVNKEKILPLVYLVSLVMNILLNILLIPRYGYIASAWITVFTEGLVLIMFGYYTARVKD